MESGKGEECGATIVAQGRAAAAYLDGVASYCLPEAREFGEPLARLGSTMTRSGRKETGQAVVKLQRAVRQLAGIILECDTSVFVDHCARVELTTANIEGLIADLMGEAESAGEGAHAPGRINGDH